MNRITESTVKEATLSLKPLSEEIRTGDACKFMENLV